ncbi:MAG TPA: hypothetical protein VG407_13005 [Caulobacteraceae bacterium]|jgi:hypothetical protein|nr:hypothetical protein [Caulobacteraceae bacterium]
MTDDKRPITPDDKIAIEDSPGAVVAPAPTPAPATAPKVGTPPPVVRGLESSTPAPSAWQPAPLAERPPWRPPSQRAAFAAEPLEPFPAAQTFDTSPPPIQTFDAREPTPPPRVFEHVDPDHFAIAETDDGADTIFDSGFGWFGRLVGDQSELAESAAARAERALGWTSRTILIAALLMLVFNARSLQSWASTLPPQWGSETLRLVAGEWAGRLQDAGFDEPRRRAHAAYETSKTLRWDGSVTQAK